MSAWGQIWSCCSLWTEPNCPLSKVKSYRYLITTESKLTILLFSSVLTCWPGWLIDDAASVTGGDDDDDVDNGDSAKMSYDSCTDQHLDEEVGVFRWQQRRERETAGAGERGGESDSPVWKKVMDITSGGLVAGICRINDSGDSDMQEQSICSFVGMLWSQPPWFGGLHHFVVQSVHFCVNLCSVSVFSTVWYSCSLLWLVTVAKCTIKKPCSIIQVCWYSPVLYKSHPVTWWKMFPQGGGKTFRSEIYNSRFVAPRCTAEQLLWVCAVYGLSDCSL